MKNILLLLFIFNFSSIHAQWIGLNSGTTENLNEVFFPVTDTGYVVGNKGTVLKTTDGGLNWESQHTGLIVNFNELYFLNSNEGWIVGDSGSVCHTANGGATWNCSILNGADSISLNSVYALDESTVIIGGQHDWSDGYIAKSNNGGVSWQRTNIEKYVWDINIKKIGMINENTGFAITRGYVLKTNDGGLNWFITDTTAVHSGLMFHILEDMAFFPNNDTAYVCGWYGAYLGKTVNAGLTWQHQNEFQAYNLDFINPEVGYVGGWCYISKTTDGGHTFVDASGGSEDLLCEIYSIDFTDESTGYACGYYGKIIKTTNGGTTGIKDNLSDKVSINIYPNPTIDLINWSVEANVQLTTIAGQIIVNRKNLNSIDMSEMPDGIYILTLSDEKGNIVHRSKISKI